MSAVSTHVTIINGESNLTDIPAKYSRDGEVSKLSFKFLDVDGSVDLDVSGGLNGTFTSKRDNGHYKGTLKSILEDGSLQYEGTWHNNYGESGDFSLAFVQPDTRQIRVQRTVATSADTGMTIESIGTVTEICCIVRDPFHDAGRTVEQAFLQCLRKQRISRPEPRGDYVWKSWAHGDRVRVTSLEPMADRILKQLRATHSDSWHVMTPDRGWLSKDCNVYSNGGNKGKHQDAQPYGSLVFVFAAGLACNSSIWLGDRDGVRKDVRLNSGDCMVFEGKTWHKVHNCIPNTSPFQKGEWLGDRRLSVLTRQRPPHRR